MSCNIDGESLEIKLENDDYCMNEDMLIPTAHQEEKEVIKEIKQVCGWF